MNLDGYRTAFEKQIEDNPRDLTVRKIFADWLEEYGNKPGDDDLAVHHRGWTLEKQDAKERLQALAAKGGSHCVNYNEVWDDYYTRTRELGYDERLGNEACAAQKWEPITYDLLIQIGYNWLKTCDEEWGGDHFVQKGDEALRGLFTPLFWQDWSLVTGVEVDEDKRENPFSCSC